MRSSQSTDDVATLRRYARAHRAATLAAELVRGGADRKTWARVIDAMSMADRSLARCDDAWLRLRTAYLELMAEHASRYRLRREPWAESIATACRYRGPDSDTVTRMRTAAQAVGQQASKGEVRRLEKSLHAMHAAMAQPGADGAAVVAATWRLAKWYRQLFLAEPLARAVARTVDWLPDGPLKDESASRGARLCADVGQLETARDLYEISFAAQAERLTEPGDFAARCELAAARYQLAVYHLQNGAAAQAEDEARTVLAAPPEPPGPLDGTRNRRAAMAWDAAQEGSRHLLADCLLAQGRWREAHAGYREAHARLADIERPTAREARLARELRNAVIYTGRQWRAHQ